MGSYNVRPGRGPLSRYILCRSLFIFFWIRRFGVINARGAGRGMFLGGRWKLDISIPDTYPLHPPTIKFKTRICHPNIHFKVNPPLSASLNKTPPPPSCSSTFILKKKLTPTTIDIAKKKKKVWRNMPRSTQSRLESCLWYRDYVGGNPSIAVLSGRR